MNFRSCGGFDAIARSFRIRYCEGWCRSAAQGLRIGSRESRCPWRASLTHFAVAQSSATKCKHGREESCEEGSEEGGEEGREEAREEDRKEAGDEEGMDDS